MRTVRVSADLEKRLRASQDPLCREVVGLLDNKAALPHVTGMSYQDLVREFRVHLGQALVLPPKPAVGWIVRQVARAKEIGLDVDGIRQVVEGVRKTYPRGPWELEFLLRQAPRLIHAANAADTTTEAGPGRVVSGRERLDE